MTFVYMYIPIYQPINVGIYFSASSCLKGKLVRVHSAILMRAISCAATGEGGEGILLQ